MKKDSILVNVARGPIIKEQDLADALDNDEIGGAALDTLSVEPMAKDSPFFGVRHQEKLLITPHIGWAATEARERLMKLIYDQVKEEVNS